MKAWSLMKLVSKYLTSLFQYLALKNLSPFLRKQSGKTYNREERQGLFWKTKVNLRTQWLSKSPNEQYLKLEEVYYDISTVFNILRSHKISFGNFELAPHPPHKWKMKSKNKWQSTEWEAKSAGRPQASALNTVEYLNLKWLRMVRHRISLPLLICSIFS
jgi:hypothetical protein